MGTYNVQLEVDMKTVDIVVPCYNEQEVLNMFYEESEKVISTLSDYTFTYIFVNDGSTDDTLKIMKELAARHNNVKYVSFARNFGKEPAMYAGLCNSKGDYVIVMDADLQHPPALIPKMLEKIEEGYDSCATMRKSRKGEPKIRAGFASIFYKLSNKFSDVRLQQNSQDFRIMSRQMVDAVLRLTENQRFSKGIFAWVGFDTAWIEHTDVERPAGTTKWNFKGLVKYAILGVTSFSTAPLRLLTTSGVFFAIIAALLIIVTIVRKLAFGINVSGFATMLIAILFIGGIIEISLGIIGEYIANIYIESKNRPLYIVKDSNIDDAK